MEHNEEYEKHYSPDGERIEYLMEHPEENNQPIEEKWKEALRRDWDTDALGEDDYGCDGASDNCCGNCSGWTPSIEKFESFIENLLEQERKSEIEALKIIDRMCNGQIPEHEEIWCFVSDRLKVLSIINK